eukprot:TRINITY_DN11579_c0_g1_i1.p1 TRINITY_DN11579_c0_g1~~TRINITY_DN11579_c0_g1_i1.p1  ORF type:complete len:392 (+),score=47.61 TRINITY_DN11579_c0_g1_i1:236-1411(+)
MQLAGTTCEQKPEGDISVLESLLFLSTSPGSSEEAPALIPPLCVGPLQVGEWDTTSPSPCEIRVDNSNRESPSMPNVPTNSSTALSPSGSADNRGRWSTLSTVNNTPQTNNKRDHFERPFSTPASASMKLALRHRQADEKLVPTKEYYDREAFDGSLCPLDEYYTWSYAEFSVFSPSNEAGPATKHSLGSLMELSHSYGETTRRHVIPKSCSLYLVADNADLAGFLSDPLHVHAFVCLCGNCLKLHNDSRDPTSSKIRLLLKKPNASPHYSKAWVNAAEGSTSKGQSISYDQRTGFCSLSNPSHPKSVCMLCVPVSKDLPIGLEQEIVFPIRTSTTNSCGCPRTQLKRAAAVSRQHVAKKSKPSEAPKINKVEPGEDEAAMLLRRFSCANY